MRKIYLHFITFIILLSATIGNIAAREIKIFNQGWQFLKGPFSEDIILSQQKINGKWADVTLPHTWNANDMQNEVKNYYEGESLYKKTLFAPKEWSGKRIFLKFEGVGSVAHIYVNGNLIATHKGAYSAFTCEIGKAMKLGEDNNIIVKADNSARPDIIPINHALFGIYGGIYRPVWLIITEDINITPTDNASPGVYITQSDVNKKNATISIKTKLDNGSYDARKIKLKNTIYDRENKKVVSLSEDITILPTGIQSHIQEFKIKKPHLWHGIKSPYLYKVETELIENNTIIDKIIQPLGIRNFEIKAGEGFFLNGEKYPMYGVCRHQDWWQLGSALNNEHHDKDLEMIMDIGATTVRLAHYQQSDYFYSRCDTLGLIVWAEIPFVNRVSGEESENAHTQLREMIRQGYNHPSIYVWGLHNEVYHPHSYTSQLTQSLHDLAKSEDSQRYTVAVNGYGHMDHPVNLNSDIQGMNRYFGWYEKKIEDIKPWIEKMESEYPDIKFMLTEYGADANLEHQTEILGEALNWTKPFYPETFQTKTHEFQWSIIEQHPYIIASYIWNMFDFAVPAWSRGGVPARNMKGLVTFDRKTKKDSYYFYKASWSENPVLHITQRRNKEREKQNTSITVYSNLGTPQVIFNGKRLQEPSRGYTPILYVFENIELHKGINTIKAIVVKDGKKYSDEITWFFNEEKKGSGSEYENKNEHSGF